MLNLHRQLGILIAVCVLGIFASDASAGYISFDPESHLTSFSLDSLTSTSGSSGSSVPLDGNQKDQHHLSLFDIPQMAMYLGQPSSGGMSSVSSSSGGHAPVAMMTSSETLISSLITPLVFRAEPFSPRMLIAEIFRPPCA